MKANILEWDSNYFGFMVVAIDSASVPLVALQQKLSQLKKEGVRLVYWSSDMQINDAEIKLLGGLLVDKKTTFNIEFCLSRINTTAAVHETRPYSPKLDSVQAMESLAIESGQYSRFNIDPNIPKEKFEGLFKRWIWRSTQLNTASPAIVSITEGTVAGLITLESKEGRASIGLLSVGARYRGLGIGQSLILEAHRQFLHDGHKFGQVITQYENRAACNLYTKCGYSIVKLEHYYHFWL